jgi:hypothetical protein
MYNVSSDERITEPKTKCQAPENSFVPPPFDLSKCSVCDGGKSCRKCQSCLYEDAQSPFTCLNSVKSAENITQENIKQFRVNRFLLRGFRGVECGFKKGYRFRWWVFTESDEARKLGLNFGKELHKFITWIRYLCPDLQYIVVQHSLPRRHWHILSYGSDKLPVLDMRQYWLAHYKSTISGMAEIHDIQKAIYYVAGYLSTKEKFARSWSSQGWVFRGWLGFSKAYRKQYGSYPEAELIVKLSLLPKQKRSFELDWLLNTGFVSEAFFPPKVIAND